MKMQLTSIILFVMDTDKIKNFYTQHLHLEVAEEIPGEWVLLHAGGCQLALHKIGKEYRAAVKDGFKAASNTKIVFETDADIHLLREQLIKDKILAGEIKTFPGYNYWLCDAEDPEGNVFQLKQKK